MGNSITKLVYCKEGDESVTPNPDKPEPNDLTQRRKDAKKPFAAWRLCVRISCTVAIRRIALQDH